MKPYLAFAALTFAIAAAACSPKSETEASTPTAAASPSAATKVSGAGEIDGPATGKWKMTITTMGQAMPAQETCIAQQVSLAEAQEIQQQAGMTCSEQSYRRDGAATVGRSVCKVDMGGAAMTITSDMRITGDMKTAYTIETISKMDPPPMPTMAETRTTIEAERLGDC